MDNSDTETQKKSGSKLIVVFENLLDLVLNKFLYLFLVMSLFACTYRIRESLKEVSLVVWFTIDNSIIGNRPARLFGLLSVWHLDVQTVHSVLFVVYFVVILFMALAVFLFLKDLSGNRKKLNCCFFIMAFVILFGEYCCNLTLDLTLLSFWLSISLLIFAYWFLLKTKLFFLAPVFAAAAVFVDCRAIIFLISAAIVVIVMKTVNKGDLKIRIVNILSLIVAVLILVFSFLSSAPGEKADPVLVDAVFAERYEELQSPDDDGFMTTYPLKFERYLSLSPQALLSDTLFDLAAMKNVLISDYVVFIISLFFILNLLYDRCDSFYKDESTQ